MTNRLAALLLLALAAVGCARTVQGRVLDAETRQPIRGAVVVGVWTTLSGLPGLHSHKLVGVRETETDAEGRFVLERLRSSGLEGEGDGQAVTVYKFGYIAWSNLYAFPPLGLRQDQNVPREILLRRFPDGLSRERHLRFIGDATVSAMGYGHESIPRLRDALRPERQLQEREGSQR